LIDRFDAAVYIMGKERHHAYLDCVPPGQMDTSSVQLYEWRTIDNKIVVTKPGWYDVNVNTGRMRVNNVMFTDSAVFFCSAVLPNEERVTFTHNLIGK